MNSILKTFNASAKFHIKMVGLVCILLTACGGQDTTNPREHDITPPQATINVNVKAVSNPTNIGRYDSNHHLLTTYAGWDLIIQTNADKPVIRYDNDGIDEEGEVIDGVVVGFRKPLNHVPINFTNKTKNDYENHTYEDVTVIFHQITTGYTDDGASARDLWDIDNLDPIKTTGLEELVVNEKGDYEIIYETKDTSGNKATAKRIVIVDDFILPIVTINGPSSVILESNAVFNELGATATDAYDNFIADEEIVFDANVSYLSCSSIDQGVCLNPVPQNNIETDTPRSYLVTYTATDNAKNIGTATRQITVLQGFEDELVVFNGEFGPDFQDGIFAFDQALEWNAVNESDAAPSINWDIVYSPDLDPKDGEPRANVIEITHADTKDGAGIFIQSTGEKPINLLGAKVGGIVQFDVKVISGDSEITIKSGCIHPCGGGPQDIGPQPVGEWETVRWLVKDMLPGGNDGSQGLDLGIVTTGLEIWATGQRSTVFQVDNISWRCLKSCEGQEFVPEFTPWEKVDINNGYFAPTSYAGYDLLWFDEFNGSEIDANKWSFDLGNISPEGNIGWGNGELQHYRPENASVANGMLSIEAQYHQPRLEEVNGVPSTTGVRYTSAKLITKGKFSFKYGRVDIRAVVAEGKGLWSAGWMLGDNHSTLGWPRSGEIDIVDTIGGPGQEDMIVNNMYWNTQGPSDTDGIYTPYANINEGGYGEVLASEISDIEGETFSNTFHVFSIIWTEDSVDFYVDGKLTTPMPLSGPLKDTFTQSPFYLILNVAIGGVWPGEPVFEDTDTPSQFPRGMLVDYVRVYQPTSTTP